MQKRMQRKNLNKCQFKQEKNLIKIRDKKKLNA